VALVRARLIELYGRRHVGSVNLAPGRRQVGHRGVLIALV
jgi:hypothetical protein